MNIEEKLPLLNNDRELKAFGVKLIALPDKTIHKRLIAATNEACDKMEMSHVDLLTHKGDLRKVVYSVHRDCIIVHEKLQNLLDDIDLRVLIAHELTHRKEREKSYRQEMTTRAATRNINSLMAETGIHFSSLQKNVREQHKQRHLEEELFADNGAAALYGAAAVQRALMRFCALTDADTMKGILFPHKSPNQFPSISTKDILTKLVEVSEGKVNTTSYILDERLRALRKQSLNQQAL